MYESLCAWTVDCRPSSLQVVVLAEEPLPKLALDELCKLVHNNIRGAITNEKKIQAQLASLKKWHR
ncbi:unnamed protein product [Ilex paraguariensis]|uniref:Uncharacterized protein n=1 Tax=Ilex paraguariensis TaxID=185542 RepID=A0ABC8QSD1_9AQUA